MDRYNKPQFETVDNSAATTHTLPTAETPPGGGEIVFVGNRANVAKVIGDGTAFTEDLKTGDWIYFETSNLLGRVRQVVSDTVVILDERFRRGVSSSTTQNFSIIPKNKADLRFISIERGEDEEDNSFVTLYDKDGNTRTLADVFTAGIYGNTSGQPSKKQPPFIVEFTSLEAAATAVSVTADYNYIQQNG